MERKFIAFTSLMVVLITYLVNQVVDPAYIIKNFIKWGLFIGTPYLYFKALGTSGFSDIIRFKRGNKKSLVQGFGMGSLLFATIMIAFYFLKSQIDFPQLVRQLSEGNPINPWTVLAVGLYVIVVNSFLEEFFFRGFVFLRLYQMGYVKMAYVFSSVLFGLYHIGIVKRWFPGHITLIALVGLILSGLIFGFLNTKRMDLLNSWIAHALADLAIMLIALNLFAFVFN